MAKSKGHDFITVARRLVEQAIGEHIDGTPLASESSQKDPRAVARGKIGGLKGGKARAIKLTAEQRREIAVRGAKARWRKLDSKKT